MYCTICLESPVSLIMSIFGTVDRNWRTLKGPTCIRGEHGNSRWKGPEASCAGLEPGTFPLWGDNAEHSSSTTYPGLGQGVQWSQLRRHFSHLISPPYPIPKPAERCNLMSAFLDGHARNTSPGRFPGGILARCPQRLSWFYFEPLPDVLAPQQSPATLQRRKLISSTTSFQDPSLAKLITHSSWPQMRAGIQIDGIREIRKTVKK